MNYWDARRSIKQYFTETGHNKAKSLQAQKIIYNFPHLLGNYLGYDKLDDTHSDWIHKVWTAKDTTLLEAHRGSFKTTAVLIVGCIWYLLFNPDDRILIVREEGKNAKKILRSIRDKYKTNEMKYLYKKLFNTDITLTRDTEASMTLSTMTWTPPEGNIECIGIDGSLTGGHYDRIHGDDIVTLKDRISKAKRENAILFIQELKNIINPGLPLTFTGTPWHKDDAYSHLEKTGAKVYRYSIENSKIDGFTKAHINSLKKSMSPSLFSANYELKHIADAESMFNDPNYAEWNTNVRPRAHLDAKYKGKDTMALTLMGEYNNKLHAVGFLFHENIEDKYDDIVTILKAYKAGSLYMETNADKGLAATQFRNRGIPVIDYHEKDNKHVKIITYLYRYFKNILWSYETNSEYMAQIVDYQEGQEPDDAPDSAASCLKQIDYKLADQANEVLSIGV